MELSLDGYAAEVMYYADAFEMLGVEMQVTRVGKYKSAVEPYLLNEMSPANREQIENFLGDISDVMHGDIARARGWTTAEYESILANGGLFTGEAAVDAGLLSGVRNYDEVLTELWAFSGEEGQGDDFPQITFDDYLTRQKLDSLDSDPSTPFVAVIYAEGGIVDGESSDAIGGDSVARLIRSARLDEDTAAIVLRVNSPGGSASASEVILREVLLATAVKPVVVSMGDYAASGGYWISAHADYIVAEPNTITGSIGVFGMFPNAQKLMHRFGLKVETVRTGPYADIMSTYRPRTDDELAIIQKWVDSIYDGFLDRVALGRDMPREAVHAIAQGRVWSGKDALELGLVDALGNLNDAIEVAAARAHLEGDYGVKVIEPETSTIKAMISEMLAANPLSIPTTQVVSDAAHALNWVSELHGVQARLPYLIQVR
jgi:protease-4